MKEERNFLNELETKGRLKVSLDGRKTLSIKKKKLKPRISFSQYAKKIFEKAHLFQQFAYSFSPIRQFLVSLFFLEAIDLEETLKNGIQLQLQQMGRSFVCHCQSSFFIHSCLLSFFLTKFQAQVASH